MEGIKLCINVDKIKQLELYSTLLRGNTKILEDLLQLTHRVIHRNVRKLNLYPFFCE